MHIVEVGPRDGLQNEPRPVATSAKIQLINDLMNVGIRRIEVASFVNPRRVAQMADAEAVVAGLPTQSECCFIGLVLNKRGAERAVRTKIHELGTSISASDEFGVRNQGQTLTDSLAELRTIAELARANGKPLLCGVSMAFGCPFEGAISPDRVMDAVQALVDLGVQEIAIADTIGVAVPSQVEDLFGQVREVVPSAIRLRAHFHDSRNTGIANTWAAVRFGAEAIDASVAGLGGCPFAPGATGNVATEDVVYLLERSGVETKIELGALIEVARNINSRLGRLPSSGLTRAGLPKSRVTVVGKEQGHG